MHFLSKLPQRQSQKSFTFNVLITVSCVDKQYQGRIQLIEWENNIYNKHIIYIIYISQMVMQ